MLHLDRCRGQLAAGHSSVIGTAAATVMVTAGCGQHGQG